jgi:lysophospholipase L1-like esterase
MKRTKIMIVTDSVSMPRAEIRYEDTWIYLLKKEFPQYDIIDRTGRGSTTTRLVTEGGGGVDLLEMYMPDIVIIQLGMADCAPRLFDKRGLEYRIVSRTLPAWARRRYIDHVKKHRVRDPEVTEVSPEEFRSNCAAFFRRAQAIGARILLIPILPPMDLMIRKSPHVRRNVDRYNGIYREVVAQFANVEIVDPFRNNSGMDINELAIDEVHVNAEGLKMIFESLKPLL